MTAGGGQVIWEAPHRTTNLHGWQFSPNTLFLWKVTNREERVDIQVIQLLSQCVKLKNDPSTLKRRFSLPEPYKRFDQTVPCYRGFPSFPSVKKRPSEYVIDTILVPDVESRLHLRFLITLISTILTEGYFLAEQFPLINQWCVIMYTGARSTAVINNEHCLVL